MIKCNYELWTQILRYGECEYLHIEKGYNAYELLIKNSDTELQLCSVKKIHSKWLIYNLDVDNIGAYAYNDIVDNNEYIHKTLKDVINMIIIVLNRYCR